MCRKKEIMQRPAAVEEVNIAVGVIGEQYNFTDNSYHGQCTRMVSENAVSLFQLI